MNVSLRGTFLASVVIHAGIIAPFYSQNVFKMDFAKRDSVIVDYVVLKEMTNAVATNITHRESGVTPPAPAGRIEIKNEAPAGSVPAAKLGKADYLKKLEARKHRGKGVRESVKKEAETKAAKDYLDYYGLLKEKIRSRLQGNYRLYRGEGDVYLSFSLSSKGNLLTYDVDRQRSSRDEVLLQMAGASLKGASPFPPLPKAIAADKMSFNIVISFKK